MSVEGGGVGGGITGMGIAVNIGPAVNVTAGSAVSVGPSLPVGIEGRFGPSIFGSEITSLSSPLVNEGPVRIAELENTVPLQLGFNPAGEIRFNNPLKGNVAVEAFSAEAAITEAEAIISQAQQRTQTSTIVEMCGIRPRPFRIDEQQNQVITLQVESVIRPMPVVVTNPTNISTIVEQNVGIQVGLQPEIESQSKVENKVSVPVVPAVAIQPIFQEQEAEKVEELVEEQVTQEGPGESLEEEKIGKILYLEDIEVSKERKHEIREAVIKARAEAARLGLKKIAGWLVAKFLPAEHEGNRSQVVKEKGPDGSYQETVEEIAGAGEFASEEKAVGKFDGIVTMKKPVKYGKEGAPVTNKDVARVFKYRIVKPIQAYVEVVRRVIKKSNAASIKSAGVNTNPPQGWTVKVENSLEDLGLAEVFPKAA